jgi:hypothetical protein
LPSSRRLVKFAALVERNGINLSLSNVHLSSETTLGDTDGLWLQHLVDAHIPTVDRMSGSLFRTFHVMGNSADELSRTASHYRDVDQAAEANLDTTYPASPRPPVEAPRAVPTTKEGRQDRPARRAARAAPHRRPRRGHEPVLRVVPQPDTRAACRTGTPRPGLRRRGTPRSGGRGPPGTSSTTRR